MKSSGDTCPISRWTQLSTHPLRMRAFMDDQEDKRVCHECIGDSSLAHEVRSAGENAACAYCEQTRETISLEDLADRIHEVLERDFYRTPADPHGYELAMASDIGWERAGDRVEYVIADVAGLDEPIARDVRELLSDRFGYEATKEGEEDPYDDQACYEEKGPDEWDFRESWDFFRSQVRFRSRFFNPHAQRALDEIFGDLGSLHNHEGTPAIREIMPADESRYVYRARVAFSNEGLTSILTDPVKGLGPPPSRQAKAGRMNPAGVSVFYGARDKETCIAEARAPVGSCVVIGRFEIIRPVRLLDFDVLTQVVVKGSHFDPGFHTRYGRAAFLDRLVREISRPVLPRDEEFEYLPTQAVSEYLASCVEPRLDGILFHSSQTAGTGRNIVLFNHARRIEPYDLPDGTEIQFMKGEGPEEDYEDSITIFEAIPPDKPKTSESTDFDPASFLLGSESPAPRPDDGDDDLWHRDATLRLDAGGIRVLLIRAVSYKHRERSLRRYRRQKLESEPF